MSILNVYVKKGGKKTWIEMDTFPLIYTSFATKIKYLRLPYYCRSATTQKYFFFCLKHLKVLR